MIWVTIAAIAVSVAIAASQAKFEHRQATRAVVNENKARVLAFEQFVLRTLEAAELATQHLAAHVIRDTDSDEAVAARLAHDPTIAIPLFHTIAVRTPGGRTIFSDRQLEVPPATLQALEQAASSSRGRIIVTPPLSMGQSEKLVAVVRAVQGAEGLGYAAAFIRPSKFTDFAADVPFYKDDLISLIGLDGVTRARRTGSKQSSGEDVSNTLVMRRQFASPNGTYLGPSVLDGIPRYFSHRRLEEYRLFATSGTSLATVEARVKHRRILLLAVLLGTVIAIIAAGANVLNAIDRRQRRLNEIMEANLRLNEAQRIGKIGDWDYFPAEDRLYWSDQLRAMYGREANESVSKLGDIARYSTSGDISRVTEEIRRVLETGETRSYELNPRMPDGSLGARRVIAAPVFNENGDIIGVHGTDQDISAEISLRNAEERLQDLARLDSMSALAATLAHELNQPLCSATNFLSAAKRRLQSGNHGRVEQLIEDAVGQLQHLGNIIESARDLVTHDSISEEIASTSAVLASVKDLLRSLRVGKRAVIETFIGPGAEEICANVTQLKQVLFNLGRNSLEAVAKDVEPRLSFHVTSNGDQLMFAVRDNGSGLPEGLEPFSALASNKREGLGLGLSLCRTIIEAHGGRIWVEKSDASGTTIMFSIAGQGDRLEVATAEQ